MQLTHIRHVWEPPPFPWSGPMSQDSTFKHLSRLALRPASSSWHCQTRLTRKVLNNAVTSLADYPIAFVFICKLWFVICKIHEMLAICGKAWFTGCKYSCFCHILPLTQHGAWRALACVCHWRSENFYFQYTTKFNTVMGMKIIQFK